MTDVKQEETIHDVATSPYHVVGCFQVIILSPGSIYSRINIVMILSREITEVSAPHYGCSTHYTLHAVDCEALRSPVGRAKYCRRFGIATENEQVNMISVSCFNIFSCTPYVCVGTQSFGKGVMQKTHKLTGGAAIKITVATLQTKNSGDYNGIGIKPNFEVALPSDIDLSTLSEDDQLIYDNQLVKAVEVVSTIR